MQDEQWFQLWAVLPGVQAPQWVGWILTQPLYAAGMKHLFETCQASIPLLGTIQLVILDENGNEVPDPAASIPIPGIGVGGINLGDLGGLLGGFRF